MILIGPLLREYWRPIAVGAIIAVCWWRVNAIINQRDDALKTIAELQQAAEKRNTEVEISNEQGKRATEAREAQHIADIQHIGALYGQQIQKNLDSYRSDLANRLRQQSKDNHDKLPDNVASEPASTDGNSAIVRPIETTESDYKMMYLGAQKYIETLEQAGAVCAADYNFCRDYVIGEQGRIGVSE